MSEGSGAHRILDVDPLHAKLPFMWTPLVSALNTLQGLELALVFGSVARGEAGANSDLDIAVRYGRALNAEDKLSLIRALGAASGRPIDLIDMRTAGPVVMREALVSGVQIFGSRDAFATQTSRTLIDCADYAPLVERVQRERRDAWMHL